MVRTWGGEEVAERFRCNRGTEGQQWIQPAPNHTLVSDEAAFFVPSSSQSTGKQQTHGW